jgi:iron complex transport system substrate-binding protein
VRRSGLLTLILIALVMAPTVAGALTIVDDLGRSVTLARPAERIVSNYDIDVTIPLIELGAMPIASHGRLAGDGKPYLRSSKLLTGIDFDNSDIAFIGAAETDLEAVAALKPDLIVTEISRATPVEALEKLAPTIVINSDLGAPHVYALLAAATGKEAEFRRLDSRYRAQLALMKAEVQPERHLVSVFQPLRGKLNVYQSYRAIGQVLRDAGFRFPPLIDDIPAGQSIVVSVERLPDLDADVIFDPYRSDRKQGARAEIAAMERMVPGFCRFLSACRNGRYILTPREEAISNSYAALSRMVAIVQTAFGPRPPGSGTSPEPSGLAMPAR